MERERKERGRKKEASRPVISGLVLWSSSITKCHCQLLFFPSLEASILWSLVLFWAEQSSERTLQRTFFLWGGRERQRVKLRLSSEQWVTQSSTSLFVWRPPRSNMQPCKQWGIRSPNGELSQPSLPSKFERPRAVCWRERQFRCWIFHRHSTLCVGTSSRGLWPRSLAASCCLSAHKLRFWCGGWVKGPKFTHKLHLEKVRTKTCFVAFREREREEGRGRRMTNMLAAQLIGKWQPNTWMHNFHERFFSDTQSVL